MLRLTKKATKRNVRANASIKAATADKAVRLEEVSKDKADKPDAEANKDKADKPDAVVKADEADKPDAVAKADEADRTATNKEGKEKEDNSEKTSNLLRLRCLTRKSKNR